MIIRRAAAIALLATAGAAQAENSKPQPVPIADTIPQPKDIPYPGTMTLTIDATDVTHGIFRTHETLTVPGPGPMVLLLPEWLPGTHAPEGQIDKVAGLRISAGGKPIAWRRDPVDVFAFHIDVPAGATAIDIDLHYLAATEAAQGRQLTAPDMLRVQWNTMSLYPAGYFTRQIPVTATVTYPAGWTAAAGLPATAEGATYHYQPTNYEILVDSPTLAGLHYKQWQLSDRVFLDTVASSDKELAASEAQIAAHKALVAQATKLFGAQHYDNYHFLLAISDELGGIGLEHHRSSEDGVKPGYFADWANTTPERDLLPHEYTHSWDGKFRRGADLWTPDFKTPMRDSLLWVYEGQTQFWGYVLQARSGLVSKQDTLDAYAQIAAALDAAPARQWRPLADTTNDPTMSQRRPKGWLSWQRSEDYYNEGLLIWMEVDSILRRESKGKKSMDDFARAFFGINDGDWGEVTYSFDDVVKTLNDLQPYDWRGLLTHRLYDTEDHAPIDGFAANGYRLVYTDTPSNYFKQVEKGRKRVDLSLSVGLTLAKDGDISAVEWDSAAFKAGLTNGDVIVAVGSTTYSPEKLKDAITAAKGGTAPITLTVRRGERLRSVAIDYHGGLRYPHLEKIGSGEAGLDRLLAPR